MHPKFDQSSNLLHLDHGQYISHPSDARHNQRVTRGSAQTKIPDVVFSANVRFRKFVPQLKHSLIQYIRFSS